MKNRKQPEAGKEIMVIWKQWHTGLCKEFFSSLSDALTFAKEAEEYSTGPICLHDYRTGDIAVWDDTWSNGRPEYAAYITQRIAEIRG